jgi:hypothetical protein
MKKTTLLALLLCSTAFADVLPLKKSEAKKSDPQAQMMAEMAKYSTPGEQHKKLVDALAGKWTLASKFYMAPGKPMESTGTASAEATMGGRYVEEYITATMMGQPFSGEAHIGFDLIKKKYVWSWVDNAGTGIEYAEGSADPTGKVITFKSEEMDPQTLKAKPVKFVLRLDSDKKHSWEEYDVVGGKDVKKFEVVYTRK